MATCTAAIDVAADATAVASVIAITHFVNTPISICHSPLHA